MSADISFDMSARGEKAFYDNLEKVIATSKKGMWAVVHTHFKGVVRNFLSITPPMGGTNPSLKFNAKGEHTGAVDYAAGREAGRKTIMADIKKAFWQMEPENAVQQRRWKDSATHKMLSEDPLLTLRWYLSVRNDRKRIRGAPRRPATKAQVDFVLKYLLTRQGSVVAGWKNVARFFNLPVPKWDNKYDASRSRFKVEAGEEHYYIYAGNTTGHKEANKLNRMADIAMNMQTNNMQRILKAFVETEAKRRGFVTR